MPAEIEPEARTIELNGARNEVAWYRCKRPGGEASDQGRTGEGGGRGLGTLSGNYLRNGLELDDANGMVVFPMKSRSRMTHWMCMDEHSKARNKRNMTGGRAKWGQAWWPRQRRESQARRSETGAEELATRVSPL